MNHLQFLSAVLLTFPVFCDSFVSNNSKDVNRAGLEVEVPEFFDAREQWPACESLRKIRDQQNCNGGWAFATATTMTNRLCIQTNGSVKFEFSPQDLLSCCKECGGCNAGSIDKVWMYWREHGVVSGGDNDGSHEGCVPYTESTGLYIQIPTCQRRCQTGYPVSYEEDLYFAETFYYLNGHDQLSLQVEIMAKGPVVAGFMIFEDFLAHKNDITVYRPGPYTGFMGYTYVSILGWGVEDGTPYWLVALSYGIDWGLLNGFVKIVRGENAAGIENDVTSGVVGLNRPPTTITPPSASPLASTPTTTTPSASVRWKMSWSIVCIPFWLFLSFR